MSTFAFIPARGGSTRIPDKNLQKIAGVPLVGWAVNYAVCGGVSEVVVSTDSGEMWRSVAHLDGDSAPRWEALAVGPDETHTVELTRHERPANLAGPNAQIEDAILHWGRRADITDADIIVLAQPTSPFRRPESIRACIEAVQSGKAPCAVTVTRDTRYPFTGCAWPDMVGGLREVRWNHDPTDRPRSQDMLEDMIVEAGSCWAFTWRHLRDTGCRTMDGAHAVEVDWLEAFEIDEPWELEVARALAPHVDRIREAMCTR